MMQEKSTIELRMMANQFNEIHPIGSSVKVKIDDEKKIDARIKYPAEVLFNECVKVMVYETPGYHDIHGVA